MLRFSRYGVVIVATLAGLMVPRTGLLAQANAPDKAVVVAVLDDYPAFSPTPAPSGRTKRKLRAIVIRKDPVDSTRSVIIVNPANVTPETIYTALQTLNFSRANTDGPNFRTVVGHDRPSATEKPTTLAALRGLVATLLTREPAHLRGHPGLARFTVVSEALLAEVGTPKK